MSASWLTVPPGLGFVGTLTYSTAQIGADECKKLCLSANSITGTTNCYGIVVNSTPSDNQGCLGLSAANLSTIFADGMSENVKFQTYLLSESCSNNSDNCSNTYEILFWVAFGLLIILIVRSFLVLRR
jgi:hypothetical protein